MRRMAHIARMRTEGIACKETIEITCKLTELERNTFVYETGMMFLETLYSDLDHSVMMAIACEGNAGSGKFWKWWKSEWMLWEQDYLKASSQNANAEGYMKFMIRNSLSCITASGYETANKVLNR